ncbi:MAG: hypothetical protein DRR08_23040 [Candidatus Parabeggiatoa sp. nov. 2]|nr:MAG: hypothetical protein DRR08_23040 [Gammaproteobacteria bacterium]
MSKINLGLLAQLTRVVFYFSPLQKAYLAEICGTVFFEKKYEWFQASIWPSIDAHHYTQVFSISGAFLISTTDTRSETDKRALIFNESLTWGLHFKIHKNQVFKNLCLRMRVQSLSKAYLVEICGTVSMQKSTSGFKCQYGPQLRSFFDVQDKSWTPCSIDEGCFLF